MKRLIYLFLFVTIIAGLASCSKDEEKPNQRESSTMDYSIVGDWRSKPFFLTINEDNFLTAYISDRFIDSGDCTIKYDYVNEHIIITCYNTYFQRNTTYTITKITSDGIMTVMVSYIDLSGMIHEKTLTMTKSAMESPRKNNSLIGKSYTAQNITTTFNNYNTGVRTSDNKEEKDWPLSFFYIYRGHVYFQEFNQKDTQTPLLKGWNDDADSGKIKYITVIEKENGDIEFGGEYPIENI